MELFKLNTFFYHKKIRIKLHHDYIHIIYLNHLDIQIISLKKDKSLNKQQFHWTADFTVIRTYSTQASLSEIFTGSFIHSAFCDNFFSNLIFLQQYLTGAVT